MVEGNSRCAYASEQSEPERSSLDIPSNGMGVMDPHARQSTTRLVVSVRNVNKHVRNVR